MRSKLLASICAAASAFISTSATAATVITFDDRAHSGVFEAAPSEIVSNGFRFIFGAGNGGSWGGSQAENGDPAGAALAVDFGGITISQVDGMGFDFLSLDLSDFLNTTDGGQFMVLIGTHRNQLISSFYDFDTIAGLQHLVLGFTDIKMIGFYPLQSGRGFQLDNIAIGDLHEPPPLSAIPEPATWAMMILGFGLIGQTLRRGKSPKGLKVA